MTAPRPRIDDGDIKVYAGDCLDVMRALPAESVAAVVTDPPYALPGGFMGRPWDRHDGRTDTGFAYYLSGLIDGEGSFRVASDGRRCEFTMKLRDDDRAILHRARDFIGHGRVDYAPGSGGTRPQARWIIDTKSGCVDLVGFLRRFPLRARKANDAEAWAAAVGEWAQMERGNRWHGPVDRTRIIALGERVRAARDYRDIPWSGHRFQDWTRAWAEEALRVLKPGGHLLAFGGTRTYHRLTAGIEDAGFEIRDTLAWLYGSGFPKSLDVGKAIDKAAGAEGTFGEPKSAAHAGWIERGRMRGDKGHDGYQRPWMADSEAVDRNARQYLPATPEAAEWAGWGTALKPAHEPIVLARKPLAGTVAENVLEHGTGAINVDGCRVDAGDRDAQEYTVRRWKPGATLNAEGGRWRQQDPDAPTVTGTTPPGRWPANVTVDPDAAAMIDAQAGNRPSGARAAGEYRALATGAIYGEGAHGAMPEIAASDGGPSRFYYCAKASAQDRGDGNTHPTVKPTALMRWLVRMVAPPGGIILDPFAGSGSTLVAARAENVRAIGIEREDEYVEIIAGRLSQLSLFGEAHGYGEARDE